MNNHIKIGLASMLVLLCTASIFAQKVTISGKVLDKDTSDPIPGVNILEVGTTNGAVADFDGNYTVTVAPDASLQFSFIGYTPKVVQVSGKSVINIELAIDAQSLEEVVVIGYGSITKQKLTGAVSSVDPESFKAGPITTLGDALQGNAAGLMIQNSGGQPGAAARINIRGVNSLTGDTRPLIVVDGFPLFDVNTSGGGGNDMEGFSAQMSPLAFINPADIKSVEVLKDASATAIYGNRGANGVILITTNRGSQQGSRISYNSFFGVRKLYKQLDVLDFEGYARWQNESNPGNILFTDRRTGELYDFDYADIPSVNWQDQLYRTGFVQNHSLSIQNSGEKTSTFFSLATMNDKSVLIESDFKKYNGKLGMEHNHNDKLTFGGDLSFNYIEFEGVPTEGRGFAATGATMQALVSRPFDLLDPKTYKEFVEDAFVPQEDVDNFIFNDRGDPIIQARETDLKKASSRFIGNAFVSYDITTGLSFRISAAADMYNLKTSQFYPTTTPWGNLFEGIALIANTKSINLLNENILAYRKRFNDLHDINVTAGYTQQINNYEYVRAENTSFENETLGYNQIAAAGSFRNASNVDQLKLQSYLLRVIYTFNGKLNLTASARRDGTSRFLLNKWGNFFSLGASYNLASNLGSLGFVDVLKLRASFGQVGNSNVSTFGAYSQLYQTNYTFNDQEVQGISPRNLANEGLTWEATSEVNFGIDFGFGKSGLLEGSIDYYTKATDGLILSRPIPNISGFSTAFDNIGALRNTGLEITLRSNPISTTNFSWDINTNFTYVRGEVLELGQEGAPIYINPFFDEAHQNEFILREGGQIGEIFGFRTDGIYTDADFNEDGQLREGVIRGLSTPQPGDLKFKDINGDGQINDDDRTVLGVTMPKFFGGINNTFNYDRFTLNIMLQYFLDYDVLNASRTRIARFTGSDGNISTEWLDRWRPALLEDGSPNPDANPNGSQYARIANNVIVDKYVEDASFLRISNIKLGYTFPAGFLNTKNFNVYLSVDNAFVFTSYSGYDPEVSTNHGTGVSSGIDYGAFPRARTYIAGLSLTF